MPKVHPNSIFLFNSLQGEYVLKNRIMDYAVVFGWAGVIAGVHPILFLPVSIWTLYLVSS
jgi:hypothetical protein